MQLLWPTLLSLAAVLSGQEPAGQRSGLTRQQARTLSPQDVARITLRDLAGQVQEIGRPIRQGVPYPDDRLKFLSFAFAPEAAGPGLCIARVLVVSYESEAPESQDGENLPVYPRYFSEHSVYRLAGNFDWDGNWEAPDRLRQLATCRQAGPVLATGSGSRPGYFSFSGVLGIRPVLDAVRRALSEAAAGTAAELQCAPEQFPFDPCRDPRALLRPVTMDHLTGIDSETLGSSTYRVKAYFRDPAHPDREITLGVNIDVETGPADRIVRIGTVRVGRFVIMWD